MPVASDASCCPADQQVDYVPMSTTTLEQSLQRGFSDRQVVFSGSDLRVPIAMATQLQDPMLQQILTKVLIAISPGGDALRPWARKVAPTIQTGLDPKTVLLWSSPWRRHFPALPLCCSWAGTGRCAARSASAGGRAATRGAVGVCPDDAGCPAQPGGADQRAHEVAMTNQAYRQMFLG